VCLKLVTLSELASTEELRAAIEASLGPDQDLTQHSAILKDEDRCIRCAACAMRCPTDAITMERVTFQSTWRSS
jgi:NAD-dependent dihydropyrimidine dehydrogenase PreA subunit